MTKKKHYEVRIRIPRSLDKVFKSRCKNLGVKYEATPAFRRAIVAGILDGILVSIVDERIIKAFRKLNRKPRRKT